MVAAPTAPNKKVLFVCYGGGHATMVAPVVTALNERWPEIATVVLGLTTARSTFDAQGIAYLAFADFIVPTADAEALAWGKKLLGTNHATHTGIPNDESIAYLGRNYMDLIECYGTSVAAELYQQHGRQCFMPLDTMRRIIASVSPGFVVTTTSPRAELAARRVAAEMGIVTLAITDVLGNGRFIQEMIVDHLCVNSRTAENNYRKASNVCAGEIHLVGNPAMDRMVESAGRVVDHGWRDKKFPEGDGLNFVLVAEQYGYLHSSGEMFVAFDNNEIIANLDRVHTACRANNAVMLIRPHPSLSPDLYEDWIADKSGSAFLAQKHDLAKLLNVCDLVVSNFSTIMLDALYFERPVLLVNYPESGNLMPFDKMGYATGVMIENEAEFADGMHRALTDATLMAEQQAAFRADFAELPCAHKIADIIAKELS